MKIKEEKGITGIDIATGIIIIIISSTAILALYYQIYIHMVSIKIHETAIVYITDIFEQIDLADYDSVDTESEIKDSIIKNQIQEPYTYEIAVDKYIESSENTTQNKDIIEKITIKISYQINDKENRTFEMSKIKIKEQV